jgi:hypothetical protein
MVLSSKLGVYGGVASGPHTLRTTSVLAAAASWLQDNTLGATCSNRKGSNSSSR